MKVFGPDVSVNIEISFYSTLFHSTSFFPFLQFCGPSSSVVPLPPFVWRDCRGPVAPEWGSERVCSEIFIVAVPSGPLQHRALSPGLSFSPQPLHLPSLSPSLWPRLSPVSSAPGLRFYPLTLRVAFLRELRGLQVRRRCSIQQLCKQHRQKETALMLCC